MKTLRLLITKDCNRSCEGCCNKDWDLDNLPVCKSFQGYDEIILTGGEPMLYPDLVEKTIKQIRQVTDAKIYMYTAKISGGCFCTILYQLDGVTITLHEQKDVKAFLDLDWLLGLEDEYNWYQKSLRLNVFEGINIDKTFLTNWKIKDNIKWIKNCPLPQNEVFMRLEG